MAPQRRYSISGTASNPVSSVPTQHCRPPLQSTTTCPCSTTSVRCTPPYSPAGTGSTQKTCRTYCCRNTRCCLWYNRYFFLESDAVGLQLVQHRLIDGRDDGNMQSFLFYFSL